MVHGCNLYGVHKTRGPRHSAVLYGTSHSVSVVRTTSVDIQKRSIEIKLVTPI